VQTNILHVFLGSVCRCNQQVSPEDRVVGPSQLQVCGVLQDNGIDFGRGQAGDRLDDRRRHPEDQPRRPWMREGDHNNARQCSRTFRCFS